MRNKLNELTGKDWIKFTKSWFLHRPKRREKDKILHPASYPESLIEEFICFFTKRNALVLDPFLGTGSTLIACQRTNRRGIGVEISKKYAAIALSRIGGQLLFESDQKVLNDDSRNLAVLWNNNRFEEVDFCITSPPYWNQLKRNSIRQLDRKTRSLDTVYSNDVRDIGNLDEYKLFLKEQKKIFDQVYQVLKDRAYLVIITNNIFANGRLYPLAFDTAITLSRRWVLKDEKIWLQDDKQLLPLGVYNAWVGNRHHQYCLIFRKEKSKNVVKRD